MPKGIPIERACPCDGCRHVLHCRTTQLQCDAFVLFVGGSNWRPEQRAPSEVATAAAEKRRVFQMKKEAADDAAIERRRMERLRLAERARTALERRNRRNERRRAERAARAAQPLQPVAMPPEARAEPLHPASVQVPGDEHQRLLAAFAAVQAASRRRVYAAWREVTKAKRRRMAKRASKQRLKLQARPRLQQHADPAQLAAI